MRTFVMADIHGGYKSLMQCLERSKFDYENDILIQLGDIADGWPEVYECVEELLKIKNLITIRGNHDDWFTTFIELGYHPANWEQGGLGTLRSYLKTVDPDFSPQDLHRKFIAYGYAFNKKCPLYQKDIPETHKNLFLNQKDYFIDDQNRLFVHGGFDRTKPIIETYVEDYFWDRELWNQAKSVKGKNKLSTIDNFNKIFIGHSQVHDHKNLEAKPLYAGNLVWNLDTGGGHSGKLTIMNVDTEEYFQSDFVRTLYPYDRPR